MKSFEDIYPLTEWQLLQSAMWLAICLRKRKYKKEIEQSVKRIVIYGRNVIMEGTVFANCPLKF